MIFYNTYNISIDKCSRLFEEDNPKLICRIPLPKKIAQIGFERFKYKFFELFNQKEIDSLLYSDVIRLKLHNKAANVLPILYKALEMVITYDLNDKTAKKFKQQFKDLYGKYPECKEDLKAISNQIRKMSSKLKELEPKQQNNDAEFSFENLIGYVEMVLNRNLDRNLPLYAFKKRYDEAIQKAKINSDAKR